MASKVTDRIKETFNATPKVARWILLIAAFVVVLVLLFLLINKPARNKTVVRDYDVQLNVEPTVADFSDVAIGTKKNQRFRITATHDAVVNSVNVQNSVDGFSIKTANCTNSDINRDIPCIVDVSFAPIDADIYGKVTLSIKWHDKADSEDLNPKVTNIVIPVSAISAIVQPEPVEPIVVPPVVEPVPEPAPEPPVDYTDPGNGSGIVGGEHPIFTQPEPVVEAPVIVSKPKEKCSDFAMPGYSVSGAHIGWIKPNKGRYEFHPFSDTNCNNPTGIYDPDTGIITSIDGRGRKIGTDADHINVAFNGGTLPNLKSKSANVSQRNDTTTDNSPKPKGMGNLKGTFGKVSDAVSLMHFKENEINKAALSGSAEAAESVYSSRPYDRTFILRQFKPIPATIVSEVRADPSVYGCKKVDGKTTCTGGGIPVRATVDRNVYSDNGRTIIIPTGTLLMGYLNGDLPGPYKSIGRMQINWYQFIRPDGVEFNFGENQDPYSGDAQGRVGVPGYGSTDYIEQMVMPLLTAMVPAAVNMIAPIADTFVNQIDLDNNTVVQSGTVRSSELAKNEVITAWNQVAQKLIVDALDNTVPPFSIAAGTRITVYSPVDLIATCGDEASNPGKKCAIRPYDDSVKRRKWSQVNHSISIDYQDPSWTGQVRSFNLLKYCKQDSKNNNLWTIDESKMSDIVASGYDYRTVLAYCQAQNYQARNQAKYDAYYQNLSSNSSTLNQVNSDGSVKYSDEFNKQVLGLQYDDEGKIKNPFEKTSSATSVEPDPVGSLDCDGQAPDQYGCCPGETYTDMGDQGFNCCPDAGGDCFPPLDIY